VIGVLEVAEAEDAFVFAVVFAALVVDCSNRANPAGVDWPEFEDVTLDAPVPGAAASSAAACALCAWDASASAAASVVELAVEPVADDGSVPVAVADEVAEFADCVWLD
jgi:hypothetical protein